MINKAAEKEMETIKFPVWALHYITSKFKGEPITPYKEFFGSQKNNGSVRTADEIVAELLPLVEHHKNKRKEVNNG